MTTEEILKGLNEEQLQAATSIKGAVRLIAGAGSGKTFTLTRRVAYITEKEGISPSRILSLTFTNKAAAEMRERVAKLLGVEENSLNMKTFHSLSVDIIKRDCSTVFGWKSFSIGATPPSVLVPAFFSKHPDLISSLSDAEKKALKQYLVYKVSNAIKFGSYVSWLDKNYGKIPLASLDKVLQNMAVDIESYRAKEGYKKAVKDAIKGYDDISARPKLESKIREKGQVYVANKVDYEEGKVSPAGTWVRAIVQEGKDGICSFDDLIQCSKYMLENYPEIKEYWSNQFDFIQVDEFQDTDSNQLAIVKALYERHGNLFVVGDPDQSIYLFRGAEPTLFNNLGNYIPNLTTIFMNTNYRSTEEIVNISNKVIELNKNRIPKECFSKAGTGNRVQTLIGSEETPLAEIEYGIIKDLLAKGVEPNDIAILYSQKTDKSTASLQDKLKADGIPVITTLVLESKYAPFVLGLCKYSFMQDNNFLMEAASVFDNSSSPTSANLVDLAELIQLSQTLQTDVLYKYIESRHKSYKKDGTPTLNYTNFLKTEKYVKKDIADTLSNWNTLSNEQKQAKCNLMDLKEDEENELAGNGIKVLTMHKSKGLEWPYVFVNSLSQDIMSSPKDGAAEANEKARLIYVAYSRAKTQLYMGCDDIGKMHGTLGQVVNENYVDVFAKANGKIFGIDKKDIQDNIENSIDSYNAEIDKKTYVSYTPLEKDGEIKGYRCNYSLNGELIAYQASIEDLERLNCVPKAQDRLVIVTTPIQIAKIEGKDAICFDELDKSIRRVTLTNDDEIKAVFEGSTKEFQLDIKPKNVMQALSDKYITTPIQKTQPLQREEPKKAEQPKETKQVVKTEKEIAQPMQPQRVKTETNTHTTPQKNIVKVNQKEKLPFSYEVFADYVKRRIGRKVRIVEYKDFHNVVVADIETDKKLKVGMIEIAGYVQNGKWYVSNPSILQNYGCWSK